MIFCLNNQALCGSITRKEVSIVAKGAAFSLVDKYWGKTWGKWSHELKKNLISRVRVIKSLKKSSL